VTTIQDLVFALDQIAVGDRYEVGPAIFARRPWRPGSEALILSEDYL